MSTRDLTIAVTKRLRGALAPGEQVLAGVAVDLAGTTAAALGAGAGAAVSSTTGVDTVPLGDNASGLPAAKNAAKEAGLDGGPRLVLALTSARVLLLKRRPFGVVGPVALDVPLADVKELAMSKRSQKVTLTTVRGTVPLELPKAWKFLPEVYGRVPELFAQARQAPTGQ